MPEKLAGDAMIEIQYANSYVDSYGARCPCYKDQRTTCNNFFKVITDISSTRFYLASSLIRKGGWFSYPQHILLLDCDSTGAMLAACNTLAEYRIGYTLIQSSPSHYWIIVDKIGKFSDMLHFAKMIPGVDNKYIDYSIIHEKFFLRLSPFEGKMAIFQGPGGLKNPLAITWYNEFERLWGSSEVQQRGRAERLKKQIEDGSIIDAAANPEFQL